MKFTEAPWYHTHIYEGEEIISAGEDGQTYIATVKSHADAALITSAPEMFAALQYVLNDSNTKEGSMISLRASKVIWAALQKAKGEN